MDRYIVIVEDDHLQEGPLEEQIRDTFPSARIDTVATEEEFRERLDDYRRDSPDLVVMDVMLRWAYPSRTASPAPPTSRRAATSGQACAARSSWPKIRR